MRRRRSVIRHMEPKSVALPPMGWAVTHPFDPPADCSWCERDLVDVRGVAVCPECDKLPRQPVVRA